MDFGADVDISLVSAVMTTGERVVVPQVQEAQYELAYLNAVTRNTKRSNLENVRDAKVRNTPTRGWYSTVDCWVTVWCLWRLLSKLMRSLWKWRERVLDAGLWMRKYNDLTFVSYIRYYSSWTMFYQLSLYSTNILTIIPLLILMFYICIESFNWWLVPNAN